MNKIIFVLIAGFMALAASLQAQLPAYHDFEVGETHSLIADRVNVRESASSSAKVIANIPIGTEVKILEKSSRKLELNGFEAAWYKVSFGSESGYIWGGLIADMETEIKGTKFLFGIDKVKQTEGSYNRIFAQLRAAKDNKELSRISFESIGGLQISHGMEGIGNKGLSNVKEVFQLSFSEEMCAGAQGEIYVFWDGDKLHHVKTLYSGSDVPVFAYEEFIFPDDEGGKKGKIILDEAAGEHGEDDKIHYDYQRKTPYIWTGTELKKAS